MKRLFTLAMVALAAGTMAAADIADAKRLGGGRSLGAQRQATPPPAAPSAPAAAPAGAASNPVMPAQPGAAAAAKAAPTAAPAKTGMSRWLGPVAGIAAGLGLAALASHLGIAEEMMSLIVVALLALVAFALVRMFLARRAGPPRPLEYAASAPGAGRVAPPPAADPPVFGGGRAAQVEPPAAPASNPRIPAGFAVEPFIRQARVQFARVQEAYDKGDRDSLADVMTPELFADVAHDLDARGNHAATEIVALNAELLEVVTEGERHWASVRFRGLVREDGEPMPRPLDEIWNLSKPADGSSGWLLAGIQQPDQQPASA
jgi:predicted lipid-binding transport protein (Tim44 family)